jgi:ubiquinol-cytochrome c reductase cytochrome c subunit
VNALAARRRHPAAIAVLLLIGLFLMGAAYSAWRAKPADGHVVSQDDVERGQATLPGQLRELSRPQRRGSPDRLR